MLESIRNDKRAELAARYAGTTLRRLRAAARPTDRSLRAALAGAGPGLILECKRRAPSVGVLREELTPGTVVAAYGPFASAISVLTDRRHFGGELAHLQAIRAQVDQPVLCKDFVLTPHQIYEARSHGADAVLLMLALLDDTAWAECAAVARRLGMDVLTEVSTVTEMERARALAADLVAINNRDLRDLSVDLGTTARLAPLAPAAACLVAASGVRGRTDLRRLAPQVDALLVGSALMQSADLAQSVRALAFGRIKVCGLTRAADAETAWRLGATHGGLNLVAASPRHLSPAQARAVRAAAPLAWVGVFADAEPAWVAAQARALDLTAVQLHGDESAAYVAALRLRLPAGCEIWKAVQVSTRVPSAREYGADRLLLDAPHPTLRGGTGRRFDWQLLGALADRSEYILAGGLAAGNIASADALGMHALDLNSGVESAPGRKDGAALAACFAVLRACVGRRTGGA